ncbi:MAG: glycosyltransferase [Candidatus Altiarchaeota archaeon]
MKIAFIVGEFSTLSEDFILNQITGLLEMGHEVTVICESKPKDIEVYQDSRIHYLGFSEGWIMRAVKGFPLFFRNLLRSPFHTISSLNFLEYGWHALSLRLLYYSTPFIGDKFDIVHCHFRKNCLTGSLLKEIGFFRCSLVASLYDNNVSANARRAGGGLYMPLFRKADLIITVSEHMREELIRLGCGKDKIMVNHISVDRKKFPYKVREMRGSGTTRVTTIASLVEESGVEYGIRAFAKVLDEHGDMEYTIIGDGPLRKHLQEVIAELDVNDTVNLIGGEKKGEITKTLYDSDVLIAPNLISEDEGEIPTILLEAQASGLPAISTRRNGIDEVIVDGGTGFLVKEKNVEELANKLSLLVKNPYVRLDMGEACRQHVEKEYKTETINKQLEDAYQRLVQK